MSNPDMEYVYNEQANAYNALVRKCAEKDALLRDCLPLIESVTFQGIGAELARRIRESLGGGNGPKQSEAQGREE